MTNVPKLFAATGLFTNMGDLFVWLLLFTAVELVYLGFMAGCIHSKKALLKKAGTDFTGRGLTSRSGGGLTSRSGGALKAF